MNDESPQDWPLGPGRTAIEYSVAPDGALCADGVPVTDSTGWIRFSLRPQSYPWQVRLRLVVRRDPRDRVLLFAREAVVGSREYASLHELVRSESIDWLSLLADAVHTEIDRRLAHDRRKIRAPQPLDSGDRVQTGVRATVPRARGRTGGDGR